VVGSQIAPAISEKRKREEANLELDETLEHRNGSVGHVACNHESHHFRIVPFRVEVCECSRSRILDRFLITERILVRIR
jgi:hypothetical protein